MLGSSGVTNEEKPRSLSKHLFITNFSSEWDYTHIISVSSVSPNSVIMQSTKLQTQRQSFIQNILDPKPNFEILLISNYCNSLKIEAHKKKKKFIIPLSHDTSPLSPWSSAFTKG